MSTSQGFLPFDGMPYGRPITRDMATWAGRTLRTATDEMLKAIAGYILAMWRHYWRIKRN